MVKNGINLSHNKLFLFGVIFYLVIPPIVGYWGWLYEFPGMIQWHRDFQKIPDGALIAYTSIVCSYIIAFYAGSFSIIFLMKQKAKVITNLSTNKFKNIRLLFFFSIIMFLIVLFFSLNNINILFKGYETYDVLFLGQIATINIVALFFVLYLSFLPRKTRYTYYFFFMTLITGSIVLIGLGSRMYILITMLSFIIYRTNYSNQKFAKSKFATLTSGAVKKIGIIKLIIWIGSSLVGILLVGAWRIGAIISYNFLIYLLFAEPIFTWWSSSTFLSYNFGNLNIVDYPSNYITSFLNFVPSILFENKAMLITSISDKYYYEAPLGANSIFVSIQGNFGWFLGSIFMFLLGFYYSLIKHFSKKSIFFTVYYILILSLLPFQFFRDGFSVVNKQLFWNMLLVPALMLLLSNTLHKWLKI